MSLRSPRAAAAALIAGLLLLLLTCALAGFAATSRPGTGRIWGVDTPIGRHIYSVWLLPCDQINPGQILLGRDLMIYSSYPPPGLKIPLAPACP